MGLAAPGLDDVGGHVGDLLLAQLAAESRHTSAPVRHLLEHLLGGGARLVQVGPDGPARSGIRKGVTAAAAGGGKDLLAGGRVACGAAASAASLGLTRRSLRKRPLYAFGGGRDVLLAAAAGEGDEAESDERKRQGEGPGSHRAGSIPRSAAR